MSNAIDKSALEPEVAEYVTKLEDTVLAQEERLEKAEAGETTEDDGVEALLKSADPALVEYVQGIEKSAQEALAKAETAEAERVDRVALAKADTLGELGEQRTVADILKSAAANMPADDYAALDELLTKANGQIETGKIFAELGKGDTGPASGSDRIEKAAEAVLEKNPELTREQAIDKALEADSSLYADYIKDGGN